MSDPIRRETSVPDETGSQDATIERLLLTGLDQYFSGQYERAIHVWTRVLFIDRGHTRARAYIERARSALAERQRESEELLHGGAAALESGDFDRARDLLTSAVERGVPQEDALLYLDRLSRLDVPVDPPAGGGMPRPEPAARRPVRASRASRRTGTWLLPAVLVLAFGLLLASAFYSSGFWPWQDPVMVSAPAVDEELPVPRHSEVTLAQARALHERGHLYESLRLLERIRSDDPFRAEADLLRGSIQRALLEAYSVGQVRGGNGNATGR